MHTERSRRLNLWGVAQGSGAPLFLFFRRTPIILFYRMRMGPVDMFKPSTIPLNSCRYTCKSISNHNIMIYEK